MPLTGGELGSAALDPPYFPGIGQFDQLDIRPWYYTIFALVLITLFVNLRVRDSRLGRAWIALREDEVAAVSMGIPLVRTKLLAYALGAAFGGIAGAFLGAYTTLIDADEFQFGVLDLRSRDGDPRRPRVDLGGRDRGVAARQHQLLPDPGRAQRTARHTFGLNFNLTDLQVEHLRLPARARDGAAPAGADPRAPAKARADRGDRRDRARRSPTGWTAVTAGERRDRPSPAPARRDSAPAGRTCPRSSAAWSPSTTSRSTSRAVDRLDNRSERRRQDDAVQHAHGAVQADQRADRVRRRGHHARRARTRSPSSGSRGRSRTSACSAR